MLVLGVVQKNGLPVAIYDSESNIVLEATLGKDELVLSDKAYSFRPLTEEEVVKLWAKNIALLNISCPVSKAISLAIYLRHPVTIATDENDNKVVIFDGCNSVHPCIFYLSSGEELENWQHDITIKRNFHFLEWEVL